MKYVQNDPGGTIGGPDTDPACLRDGRNKTFFFVDFNVTWPRRAMRAVSSVPTDLQKAGDFSQTSAKREAGVDLRPEDAGLSVQQRESSFRTM